MVLALILFAIALLALDFLLGLAVIYYYYLLPTGTRCPACGGETVPLAGGLAGGPLSRLTRTRRRWCLACGGTMLARRTAGEGVRIGPPPDGTLEVERRI